MELSVIFSYCISLIILACRTLAFNRFYLDSALLIGNVEIMKAA